MVSVHITSEAIMLRNKHLRLDQDKISKVREILDTRTETEALDKALDEVIRSDRERLRRRSVMRRIVQLRDVLGVTREDSADWIREARDERTLTRDRGWC
jgi:hypothetical protein